MPNQAAIKPSRWYYVLAAVLALAGIALFVIFLVTRLSGLTSGLRQVLAPGTSDLPLKKAGRYTIFLERHSVMNGRVYAAGGDVSGLHCTLVNKATGAKVPLSQPSTSSSYDLGGRSGVSVLQFDLARPGVYKLSAAYPKGRSGPRVVLAVGHGFVGKILTTVFGGLGILGGSLVVALLIGIVTLLKRIKAKRAMLPPLPQP